MRFLNPTVDIVFKKLFGDQHRTGITINFLNSILELQEGALITGLIVNDVANQPETLEHKTSFVDVRCTDQRGKQYIIEMQVVFQQDFLERAQYYGAAALYNQLKSGGVYGQLMPVILVAVLDFTLFPGQKPYLSHHGIVNLADGTRSLRHMEYHFLELPKFDKSLEELNSDTDRWTYFIKKAGSLGEIPQQMQSGALQEAFHVLERTGWSALELREYEGVIDRLRCETSQRETARLLGREEGKTAATEDFARRLLSMGMELPRVAELTGLSVEQLKKL